MKVSVVTISYNQAEYIERALRSVIEQEGIDLEYIVVDPGSCDGSRDIILQYSCMIDRIILEKDNGAADGLNKGFAVATGDIFAFINSDDELLPGALAKVVLEFERDKNLNIISGCGYFIDESDKSLRRIIPSEFTPWLYAHGAVTLFQQGTFFRRECFTHIGGFNPENRTCWDGELFLDMVLAGFKPKIIYEDYANFRMHGSSITVSGRLEKSYKADMSRLFEKAMGRKTDRYYIFTCYIARLLKLAFQPSYLWNSIFR
ncbi:glycosyltransferase family 2 protein [Perlucidibaca aquatica]|uniref:glycosyltransferase family 2 protein n=1 Tax=Perlucidibaca aquatica TaxID=1852776 RepID=UPI00083A7F15|nr:glycosyltransferase family 2 protein [Perlucidibaca aquatica]